MNLCLGPREAEIIGRLLDGRSRKQIAFELGISPHTVNEQMRRLYAKLGVQSQTELLVLVFAAHLQAKEGGAPGNQSDNE